MDVLRTFKRTGITLAMAMVFYGINLFRYVLNASHIQSQLANGIVPNYLDRFAVGFWTGEWWAFASAIVFGLVAAFAIKGRY